MEIPEEISAIAKIIREDWKKIHYSAVPYLNAMDQINSVDQIYSMESAESIIRYFLVNATNWRGEVARSVKAKLKQLLQE